MVGSTSEIEYVLLDDFHNVIASSPNLEELRSIGNNLARINGEPYYLGTVTETITTTSNHPIIKNHWGQRGHWGQ